MKKVIPATLFVLLISLACAQTPQEIFLQANRQYEAGAYEGAISAYENLIRQGWESASLYYNLGNAYFKSGKTGLAILNYERAKILNPRDEDIKFNLEYARASAIQEEEKAKNPIREFFTGIYNLLSVEELTIVFTLLYFSLILAVCISFFFKSGILRLLKTALGILVAVSGLWWAAKIHNVSQPYAIVVKPDCSIRSGPGMEYTAGYLIPEGKKVLILRVKDSWYEVGLKEEGLKGWTEVDKLEKIRNY